LRGKYVDSPFRQSALSNPIYVGLTCNFGTCSANTSGFKANSTVYIAGAVVAGVVVIFAISLVTWLCIRRRKQRGRLQEDQNVYRYEHQQRPVTAPQQQNAYQQPWIASAQPPYNSPAPPYASPAITPVNPFDSKAYDNNPIELAAVEKPSDAHFFELQGDENWSPLEDGGGGNRRSKLIASKSTRNS
jgi:hypothetical protein